LIFLTVGAQMPFDRLVRWVDDWAGHHPETPVVAQIGPTDLAPRHVKVTPFLDPPAFRALMTEASAVVAHAGMGTILTALELGKPVLVVPRLGKLDETRNDHQVATAERFVAEGLVRAAYDEAELVRELDRLASAAALPADARITPRASATLLKRVREYALG